MSSNGVHGVTSTALGWLWVVAGRIRRAVALNLRVVLPLSGWLLAFLIGLEVNSMPFRLRVLEYANSFQASKSGSPATTAPTGTGATPGPSNRGSQVPAAAASAPSAGVPNESGPLASETKNSPGGRDSLWLIVWFLIVIAVSHTPPNLALLCILGALLGAEARAGAEPAGRERERRLGLRPAVNGLAVFLAMLAGLIVVQGGQLLPGGGQVAPGSDDPGQQFYLRLAATATIFSIAAGANPRFMVDIASLFGINRTTRAEEQKKEGPPPSG